MPQSHAQVWLHIIFSTKDRRPFLQKETFRTEMFRMLAHHVKESKCTSASVGGYSDHVHLLLGLSRTLTIAKLVEDVKTETSKWAKHHKDGSSVFSWQSGYRAFSVIDIPNRRMIVRSQKCPKTRICPIFPELLPHLIRAREMAPPGAEMVQTRYSADSNIGTTFTKIIEKAGLVPWDKLFQNLRATRETELMATYPDKDVASWIGNSVPVAMKHYAMSMQDSFDREVKRGGENFTPLFTPVTVGPRGSGAPLRIGRRSKHSGFYGAGDC